MHVVHPLVPVRARRAHAKPTRLVERRVLQSVSHSSSLGTRRARNTSLSHHIERWTVYEARSLVTPLERPSAWSCRNRPSPRGRRLAVRRRASPQSCVQRERERENSRTRTRTIAENSVNGEQTQLSEREATEPSWSLGAQKRLVECARRHGLRRVRPQRAAKYRGTQP